MAEATPTHSADAFNHVTAIGKAVGDPLRASILLTLKEDSFAVSELCTMLNVPQPALSHHLKVLHRAGLVAKRREGTSIFYRRDIDSRDPLKHTLFAALDASALSRRLRTAMAKVHDARRQRCMAFFASHADEIARLHKDIAEPETYSDAMLIMAARLEHGSAGSGSCLRALEIGPGNALLLDGLAAQFDEVVGVDSSPEMLAQAAAVAARRANVTLREDDFFVMDASADFDLVAAAMVVHHLPSPAAFFQQAARLLRPGGSLLIAELTRHDQRWASEHCGDQWLGFEPAELEHWAKLAGLAPAESLFLAQKNGFQIQVQRYAADLSHPSTRRKEDS